MNFLRRIIYSCLYTSVASAEKFKRNVLFIVVDDLKVTTNFPNLPSYTPNLDAFKDKAFSFMNAQSQYPMCGPSRASMLTGLLPTTTRIFKNFDGPQICDYRRKVRNSDYQFQTLNELFTRKGYITRGVGKLYHRDTGRGTVCGEEAKATGRRWTKDTKFQNWSPWKFVDYRLKDRFATETGKRNVPVYQFFDVDPSLENKLYLDKNMTSEAIHILKGLIRQSKPWMLMVGLRKPHLPYIAPKRFWDLFAGVKIVPQSGKIHRSLGKFKAHVREDRQYQRPFPKHHFPEMIKGYYACVAFIDEQIGRLLRVLESSKSRDNTIVIITSDNGYSVGEHGFWAKHNMLDNALRVPLIIYDKRFGTGTSHAPVELVDIFPTLIDLTKISAGNIQPLDGVSLKPILTKQQDWVKAFARSYGVFNAKSFYISKRTRTCRYISKNKQFFALLNYRQNRGETRNLMKRFKGTFKMMKKMNLTATAPFDQNFGAAYSCCYTARPV